MTTNTPTESLEKESISLKEQITALTKDLLYPSESDEPISYFEMELSTQEPIGIANFKMFNGILPEIASTEIEFEAFFKP
ncbi:MAG: nuclease A inhibitor family protein, partial [Spirosomataceae bacterium]